MEVASRDCRLLGEGRCGPFKRSVGVQRGIEGGAGTLTAVLLSPPPEEAVPSSCLANAAASRLLPGIPADRADVRARPLPARVA